MDMVVLILRLVLVAVFGAAAIGKALDLAGSRRAVEDFGVTPRLAAPIGTALPAFELLLAVGLLLQPLARVSALGALVLLLAFCAGIARLMRQGDAPSCHCFGQIHAEPVGVSTLIRNGVLATCAAVALGAGPGQSLASLSGQEAALVLTSVALVGALALSAVLWRENRALRAAADAAPKVPNSGPPLGSGAPDVDLRTLDGTVVPVTSIVTRASTPTVLVQVGLGCESCHELMPSLVRWAGTVAESLTIRVVSSGDQEANEAFARDYDVPDLLLADGQSLAEALDLLVTPSAVLFDARGRVSDSAAIGGIAIEALIRSALRHDAPSLDGAAV